MKTSGLRVTALVVLALASMLVVPVSSVGAVELSQDQAFVTAAYQDFLGRAPTSGEMAAATRVPLGSVSARSMVVKSLSMSPEWITVTVNKLYEDTLGRSGDPGGVAYWVGLLAKGKLTVAQVAASLYSSAEYFSGIGGSTNRTWVSDLYLKILLRSGSGDPAGVTYWTNMVISKGRYTVAYEFYQSDESRHTRVKGLYAALLGRAPDSAGWDYWANLVTTTGDLALAANLASSAEYYQRASTRYGIRAVGDHITSGGTLTTNQALVSPNGTYAAIMQGDGNFVVYNQITHAALWSTHTSASSPTLVMQGDGNLVVYAQGGVAKWSSGTGKQYGLSLWLQNDGNLVIYTADNRAVWDPGGHLGDNGNTLGTGNGLGPNHFLISPSGTYTAVMQADGNFVVYNSSNVAVWAIGTGVPNSSIVMQNDGNLVLYAPGTVAKWSSGTAPASGVTLQLQDDGNLVLYAPGQNAIWSRTTGIINHLTPAEAAAINWAKGHLGQVYDTDLCLTFVFDAYGAAGVNLRSKVTVPIGSNTYPVDIWGHFNSGTTGGGMTPPAGALVFWKAKNGDRTLSHVALSTGGGNLISTTDAVNGSTVHTETMAQHSYAIELGWWLPA